MNILNKGIDLSDIGVNEFAYAFEHLQSIVDEVSRLRLIILGGDIYKKELTMMCHTYDSWYYDADSISHSSPASITKMSTYLENYIKNNGSKDYYFTLILK